MAASLVPLKGQDAPQWDDLWASFERSLRAAGKSPRTVKTYADGGKAFRDWLIEGKHSTDPGAVSRDLINRWLIELREEGRKPATVRARWGALHRFFAWLVEEEEVAASPLAKIKSPSVNAEPAPILSDEELERLFKACSGRDFSDRRDLALLRLLFDAGLRRAEAAAIQVGDLDLNGHQVVVTVKGGRKEVAFFGDKTAAALDRYLRVRSKHRRARLPALWLAPKGALTSDGIYAVVERRARGAGISRRITPHQLRHAMANSLKSSNLPDEIVMSLGRWRDPRVMRRYAASAALERAKAAHQLHSPGDRI